MMSLTFTEEEQQALYYERFHHPHPRVQLKMEVVYLKSQGVSSSEIERLTRLSENTVRSYLNEYATGGIEKLKEIRFYHPVSELAEHAETLKEYFREHPPVSIPQAVAVIEELTGIRRSETQVRQFLTGLGMKRRKVGMIPAKADPEQQESFKKKSRTPLRGGESRRA